MWGSQSRHQYYLTRSPNQPLRCAAHLVPYFPHYSQRDLLWDQLRRAAAAVRDRSTAMRKSAVTLQLLKNGRLEATVPVRLSAYTRLFLSHLGINHDHFKDQVWKLSTSGFKYSKIDTLKLF